MGWPRLAWYKIAGIAVWVEHGRETVLQAMKRRMVRDIHHRPKLDGALAAAALALAVLLPGCSSSNSSIFGGPTTTATSTAASPPVTAAAPPPSSVSLGQKIENFFATAGEAHEARPVTNPQQANVDCPLIDIRQGAATLTIPPPPPDGSNDAMTLKYQGTFVRAARDCKVVGTQLVMRIGVQGRVIVGPAGGPGPLDVPLRLALVDQPPSGSKTILTKLIRIPVVVDARDDDATFTHIEDNFAFPLPSSAELDNYLVYIGFDPIGAEEEDRAKRPAAHVKPKPRPNPNAPTG